MAPRKSAKKQEVVEEVEEVEVMDSEVEEEKVVPVKTRKTAAKKSSDEESEVEKPVKKGKGKKATKSSDEESEVEEPKVEAKKGKGKKAAKSSDEESEVEEPKVETKKGKAKKAPVVKTDSDSEESGSGEEKKSRKTLNLNDVLSALESNKVEEAKKKLQKYIEKYGSEGKKRVKRAPGVKTEYNEFFSAELKRLAEIENKKSKDERIPPKDRMKMVSELWRKHKEEQA